MTAWMRRAIILAGIAGGLIACGPDAGQVLPPQQWNGVEIRVEVRPSPLGNGTSEFLVMATRNNGRPAHGLFISLRGSDSDPWIQAIEDGQVGVYRRGVKVAGEQPVLQVQIRSADQQGELRFLLKQDN